jgi:hypothetical protein
VAVRIDDLEFSRPGIVDDLSFNHSTPGPADLIQPVQILDTNPDPGTRVSLTPFAEKDAAPVSIGASEAVCFPIL